jgi:glyoxylate reductase
MAGKPRVVVTRRLPDEIEARMCDLFDTRLNVADTPFDEPAITEAMGTADVLVPTVSDRVNARAIAAAGPRLRLIANFGVGVNHIDLAAARARGIAVTNTPDVLTDATADIAIALILAVTRRMMEGAKILEAGQFRGWSPTWMMGVGLRHRRLGILGMGRIGRAVAARARAFGMQIHYHNRTRVPAAMEEALEATYWPELDRLFGHADVISLNCPSTPETRHLVSARRLRLMKPSAYLVNTARGDIVDEAALADALAARSLAGAGLDVYEREPAVHPKLIGLKNVVLLPHLGSGTIEARNAMGEKVIANIKAFAAGHKLPDAVVQRP